MQRLRAESDGIVFGYTRRESTTKAGGRTYKSMNYHRQSGYRPGKNIWHPSFAVSREPVAFDESDFARWEDARGNLWWTSAGAAMMIGTKGERIAFFPACANHPGPWHGYPVAPRDDEDYEIPEQLITLWESAGVVDDLVAGRMRRGKI